MISFHREGPTLPGRSSRLADHPNIKGYRARWGVSQVDQESGAFGSAHSAPVHGKLGSYHSAQPAGVTDPVMVRGSTGWRVSDAW